MSSPRRLLLQPIQWLSYEIFELVHALNYKDKTAKGPPDYIASYTTTTVDGEYGWKG